MLKKLYQRWFSFQVQQIIWLTDYGKGYKKKPPQQVETVIKSILPILLQVLL